MLTFFRRIRLRLSGQTSSDAVRKGSLGSGQTRKYILYATGEVLLVMVGILLALQVNNWNSNRLDKIEEKVILRSLLNEFNTNSIGLENAMKNREKGLNGNKELLALMNKDIGHLSTDYLDELIGFSRYITTFEPKTGILEGIINSGRLDLIKNVELRNELASWGGALDDLQKVEFDQSNIIISQYNPYLAKNLTIRNSNVKALSVLLADSKHIWGKWHPDINTTHNLDYQSLFLDPEFESLISKISIWRIGCYIRSKKLHNKIMELIELIQNEIKR